MNTQRQTRQMADLKSDNATLRRMLDARMETIEDRLRELERTPVNSGHKASVVVAVIDHLTGRKEQVPFTFSRDRLFGEENIQGLLVEVENVFRSGRAKVLGS